MSRPSEREISVLVPPHLARLAPGDPGSVGPYVLIGRIGAGATGTVFAAVDPAEGGDPLVAVKVLHPWPLEEQSTLAYLHARLAALQGTDGRVYVPPITFDAAAERPWLALPYIPGVALDGFVREHGPLGRGRLIALAAALGEGLSALHSKEVAHGDLKPGDVLLCASGPRLLDCALPGEGELLGRTAWHWTAPERLAGGEPSPAADVFSWGAIAVFAATGRPPVEEEGASAATSPWLEGVPGELRPIVRRSLSEDPRDRPTVREVLGSTIAAWESISGSGAGPVQGTAVTQVLAREWRGISEPDRLPRLVRLGTDRRRTSGRAALVAGASVVALALVGGGGYAAYGALSGDGAPQAAPSPSPSSPVPSADESRQGPPVVRFDPAEQENPVEGPWVYTRVERAESAPATPAATIAPATWSEHWTPVDAEARAEAVITAETEVRCAQFCVPGPGYIEDGRGTYEMAGQDFIDYLSWGKPVIAEVEFADSEGEGDGPREVTRITELYPTPAR
ncbi:serine/threonine-protein kinase [Streptomonospora litoralis]|uniref:Serine/threonine-protein kinase AfsK n=1 Tax=Streptomonospora litoralis TaxID=2498135 RepID=A0A4V0ZJY5_9ACTN|nr:serine/threonine-protein kinase [Streptomonospora litoralis]QBI55102.1 Serine/threonine-protein kinase AfsK [Streptomonospora litoralis]